MEQALARAIHRAAYIGIDHVDKDADTSEICILDSKGHLTGQDGRTWKIVLVREKGRAAGQRASINTPIGGASVRGHLEGK